ncbi:hypothetical protein [Actinoallomurus sp. CA-150999]|uniref:hypothetical protein n=1 Tax=Actinoallomurus sp. CA-150999 TaxID=3239887 RepID=UPI003D8F650C
MLHRYRDGRPPVHPGDRSADEVVAACERAPVLVDAALDSFDFRAATGAVRAVADAANRFINRVRPWELARAERAGDRGAARDLDAALAVSLSACRTLGEQLSPFLPDAADRIARQCTAVDGRVPAPSPVFPRLAGP